MAKAKLLEGRSVADKLRADLRARTERVAESRGTPPRLAILSIGGDPASQLFLKSKLQACKEVGLETTVEALHAKIPEAEVLGILADLAKDPTLDGIMLELPVPSHLDPSRLSDAIAPDLDAEGITTLNLGRFYSAKSIKELERSRALVPCTANALIRLLLETGMDPGGKQALVVGRSGIVGRPAAHLLSCLNATVTLAHSHTHELAEHVRRADIVVAAAGRPGLIRGEWIKPGAVVLDAGVNQKGGKIAGDVEFDSAARTAGFITPVPGGVGPLTVYYLLHNTVLSAERRL